MGSRARFRSAPRRASTRSPSIRAMRPTGSSFAPTRPSRSGRSASHRACPDQNRSGPRAQLLPDLLRQHEANVLVDGAQLRYLLGTALAEELDEALDQLLGGAGAGGDADGLDPLQPGLLDLGVVVDQVGVGAVL